MFWSIVAQAQEENNIVLTQGSYAEKIYVQLDADVYTTDQTIWFKAVVLESARHLPSSWSGVLHVQLINPDGQLVVQKRIKLTSGSGNGAIELKSGYVSGKYLLKAYTEWNHNFGSDFTFQRYIDVFPQSQERKIEPIMGMQMEEREPNAYQLQAKLFPRLLDKLHKKQLAVYVIVDGKKDSMLLREGNQGYYHLDYPLTSEVKAVTIQMKTENNLLFTKTLVTPNSPIDVQFFPEGGVWLPDIPTKLGFKAINQLGKAIAVSGKIMNDRGDTLTSFRSNHLGMGTVLLKANKGSSYYAVLDTLTDESIADRYPLPQLADKGYALAINQVKENINVLIRSSTLTTDSLFVQISCRGVLYYLLKISPRDQQVKTLLPNSALPEGIILFTLLDHKKCPIAERLIFNRRSGMQLTIESSTDKTVYGKREKTAVKTQVFGGDGLPTEAKLSVMAISDDHIGKALVTRNNILTHFLLQSELRGEIAEPNYYFQEDVEQRFADLDALMLTQGWRRYKYDEPVVDSFSFPNELLPSLRGEVLGVFSKKKQPGITLTMMSFGENNLMQVEETDSLGRFYFPLSDQYVDTLDVLLQSANKAGRNRDYTIQLDKQYTPQIEYDYRRSAERIDSVVSRLAKKRHERFQHENAYRVAAGEILLEEVVVEAKVRSPEEQTVFDRYGEADVVITGKAIQEKEKKWSYGLYSILLFNFPKDIRIDRVGGGGGYLKARVHGTEPTLVVVDGIPVSGHSYDAIAHIPPSEVKSFEIIRFAKNFHGLYQETYPDASPLNIPTIGHVIAIYTHAGKGVYGVRRPTGLIQASVPVYSPVMEFYTPRYESEEETNSDRPDLRTLLHWEPNLSTDDEGKVTTDYYNGDNIGEVRIIIEAFNSDGYIGYRELVYQVH
ncbi:hypothetical protein H8B06_07870 [Sphingobacterium sp. DN00404]|uniref:TonB-dependent receptor plug domain-containing protein n=1 Tax=Sphingobacterium micropteri TaxID=2763501 RepID=A0ABR7YNE4_9SPHI|nr:Plug domain-containing protein [Sphingobacterium micropteri]MBD1432736.1 hypothetical protein [Sphingobacterium micropteri]